MEDVDFEDPGNADDDDDNEGWETEDEMEAEAERDDSELTFSKHTGKILCRVCAAYSQTTSVWQRLDPVFPSSVQARCSA